MTSRDPVFLPRISSALLVPVDPTDDAVFKRRVTIIKSLITELEDENNLIAYKIAKTRRRIEEKKARIASQQQQQATGSKGFWGARKPADNDDGPKLGPAPARKRDRTRSKPRPSKSAGGAAAKNGSAKVPHDEGTPNPSVEEVANPGSGGGDALSHEPEERISDARSTSRKSLNGPDRSPALDSQPASRDPNDMDVDDFDDY